MRTSAGLHGKGAEGASDVGASRRWREALAREEAEDLPAWRRRAVLSLAAGLAVAAALVVAIRIQTPNPVGPPVPVASTGTRSMAILPLRNVSGSAADAFLLVGLADALITRLDEYPSLSIRPMPSILRIQREPADQRTAAKRLKVDVVLEGEFVAVDSLVRVTLQLTEARSGRALWAESIEGQRDDLLGLVDRLTARTESRLHDGPRTATEPGGTGSEPRSTNAQAYESYMRARSISGSLVRANYVSQVRALRRAIELDPNAPLRPTRHRAAVVVACSFVACGAVRPSGH
jgi:adenylate cyclase